MSADNTSSGHRKRLRDKFNRSGLDGFSDYEIIELLLSLGTPRKDCKPAAKEALKTFKTLRGVIEAPSHELQKVAGIGSSNAFGIKLVQEVARKYLKEKIIDKPVYTSSQEIFDYLYHSVRSLTKEVFKVIYLNNQNQIIEIEDLFEGTVNSSSISSREIIERAIKHNAVSLIFTHNHPSGNPEPSKSDRELTRNLVYAGNIMGIKILDHILIGEDKYYSFAGDGIIEQYELDFLKLKLSGVTDTKRSVNKTGSTAPDILQD